MNPNRQKSPGSKPIATDINLDDLNELESLNLNNNKGSLKDARSKMFATSSTSNLSATIITKNPPKQCLLFSYPSLWPEGCQGSRIISPTRPGTNY